MEDTHGVYRVQRFARLCHELHGARRCEAPFLGQHVLERYAVDVFHDDERPGLGVDVGAVDVSDARVVDDLHHAAPVVVKTLDLIAAQKV